MIRRKSTYGKISQVFQYVETVNTIKENFTGTGFSLSCLRHFTVFMCLSWLGHRDWSWDLSRRRMQLSALIFDIQMINRKVSTNISQFY